MPLFLDANPKAKNGVMVPTLAGAWSGAENIPASGLAPEAVLANLASAKPGTGAGTLTGCMKEILVNVSVANFVLKGADLMAPGVVRVPGHTLQQLRGEGEPAAAGAEAGAGGDAEEGGGVHPLLRHVDTTLGMPAAEAEELVLVRTVGNPLPWALGRLLMSTADANLNGMRGRLLAPVHVYRDPLWKACGCIIPNDGFTQNQVSPVHAVDTVGRLAREAVLALSAAHKAASSGGEGRAPAPPSEGAPPAPPAEEEDEGPLAALPGLIAATQEAVQQVKLAARVVGVPEWEVWCVAGIREGAVAPLVQAATALVGGEAAVAAAAGEEGADDDLDVLAEGGMGGSGVAAGAEGGTTLAAAGRTVTATGEAAPWFMTQSDDELAWNCLLQALKSSVKPSKLPMLASTLWSAHILPARPVGTVMNIKGSKFKKVSTLLMQGEMQGILTLEPASDIDEALLEELGLQDADDLEGILLVTDVDRTAADLKAFKPWPAAKTVRGEAAAAEAAEEEAAAAAAASGGAFARGIPAIIELFKPLADFLPVVEGAKDAEEFWAAAGKAPADLKVPPMPQGVDVMALSKGKVRAHGAEVPAKDLAFPGQEVIAMLGRYVRSRSLYHPTDPSAVVLDATLGQGLFKGINKRLLTDLDIPPFASGHPDSISKAQLGKLAMLRCSPWHLLCYSNGDQVASRGHPPTITVIRASVPNRKTKAATLIRGLEYFGVDPGAVASGASSKFACSATVQPIPVKEGEKSPGKEVMVQGDACDGMPAFLTEEFKVPPKFITVDDSGGPKRGGKKGGGGGKKGGGKGGGRRKR